MTALPPQQRAFVLLGSLGPLGFLPASGTATVALIGLPLFWLTHRFPLSLIVPAVVAFMLVSVWVHQVGDAILGSKDSRVLVWDEITGFLVAVIAVPFTWKIALLAFFVQRTIDIVKPFPARWVEDHVPGGWGVVGDDVVAGLYTLGILHVLLRLSPALGT